MSSYYRSLIVWQKAFLLSKEVYLLVGKFPKHELYGLSDQMKRCSVSIPSNIAEGNGRGSNKEYIHFLQIARGSGYELETQILLAIELGFVTSNEASESLETLAEILKILNTLIKNLKQSPDN